MSDFSSSKISNSSDCISRQEAIKELKELNAISFYELNEHSREAYREIKQMLKELPPTQPDFAEKLYLYKCYITDKDGLQHEVIHTDDIRRVTGWEI